MLVLLLSPSREQKASCFHTYWSHKGFLAWLAGTDNTVKPVLVLEQQCKCSYFPFYLNSKEKIPAPMSPRWKGITCCFQGCRQGKSVLLPSKKKQQQQQNHPQFAYFQLKGSMFLRDGHRLQLAFVLTKAFEVRMLDSESTNTQSVTYVDTQWLSPWTHKSLFMHFPAFFVVCLPHTCMEKQNSHVGLLFIKCMCHC